MMLTTTPTRDEAAKIAKLLIDEKLAACVQLLPIESFYVWQGKTQNEPETLLLIKTRAALFDTAIARIKAGSFLYRAGNRGDALHGGLCRLPELDRGVTAM